MNDEGMTKLVSEWVNNMNSCDNEDDQMNFVSTAMNLTSNALGVFIAQRIMECDCSNCREGANEFMINVLNSLEQAVITTINGNLEANKNEPLFELKDPAADPGVNQQTYNEIMKELNNGN